MHETRDRFAYPWRMMAAVWLGGLVLAGCSAGQASPTMTRPAITPTLDCRQELILPQLTEIQPAQPAPGSEITVVGSGGYLRDNCGGYIEGLRDFTLYLDREAAGSLSCYVNRCEAKLALPAGIATGLHCLSVEADRCSFEFQVVSP